MDHQPFEDNSYSNYSILSTNLTSGSNKFKKIYRMSSPVQMESYGNNNFLVELKFNSKKNNINNDEYDFIEKELKKSRKNKAYTTYTEISNEESLFFGAQNQSKNQRYCRDSTNYNTIYHDNINNVNKFNNYYNDKNNFQTVNKDNMVTLVYPNDKFYFTKKNFNKINKNELKYQRFSTSFISKDHHDNNKNKSSSKKIIINKNDNFRRIEPVKKMSNFSKSKNQLEDFNIDKLKEIGDHLALRYMNRTNKRKVNIHNRQNQNIINNMSIISDKKEKHDAIINKIINIEKKRKESKNKVNIINKTEAKVSKDNYIINNTPNYNINYKKINVYENKNNLNNRFRLLNMNKREEVQLKVSPSPITKKIKINNLIRRKRYILNNNTNNYRIERNTCNIKNNNEYRINNINNEDKNNKNKINLNNNKNYQIIQNKNNIDSKNEINEKYFKIKVKKNLNNKAIINKSKDKENSKHKSKGKENSRNKSKDKDNLINKNINHKYIESIKNNKRFKKNQHSFNNLLLPLQKVLKI